MEKNMKKEIVAFGWNSRFALRTTRIRNRLMGVLAMGILLINSHLPDFLHAMAFAVLLPYLVLIWRDSKELEVHGNEIEFKAMNLSKMLRSYWIIIGTSFVALPLLMMAYKLSLLEIGFIAALLVLFLFSALSFDYWRYRKELKAE
jgi:hypothetical protein